MFFNRKMHFMIVIFCLISFGMQAGESQKSPLPAAAVSEPSVQSTRMFSSARLCNVGLILGGGLLATGGLYAAYKHYGKINLLGHKTFSSLVSHTPDCIVNLLARYTITSETVTKGAFGITVLCSAFLLKLARNVQKAVNDQKAALATMQEKLVELVETEKNILSKIETIPAKIPPTVTYGKEDSTNRIIKLCCKHSINKEDLTSLKAALPTKDLLIALLSNRAIIRNTISYRFLIGFLLEKDFDLTLIQEWEFLLALDKADLKDSRKLESEILEGQLRFSIDHDATLKNILKRLNGDKSKPSTQQVRFTISEYEG